MRGIRASVVAVLLAPAAARADDFIDTRVTWTFADDDVMGGSGETSPPSPLPGVGDREGLELFFDNLDTRYTGRESLAHLVLTGRAPGFAAAITTEASLVAMLEWRLDTREIRFFDDGTYVRVGYLLDPGLSDDALSLTLFPFTTDRFRIGYLYDLSWGEDAIFTREARTPAPGLKLALDLGSWTAFTGLKTALVPETQDVPGPDGETQVLADETQYGFLGGAGWDMTAFFRVDLSGGYFQQGRFEDVGEQGPRLHTFGASARLVYHDGLEVGTSPDFELYRNDPDYPFVLAVPEEYAPGRVSWSASIEGAHLEQRLADPADTDAAEQQPANAAAAQVRVKIGYTRLWLTAIYRELTFLLRNVSSLAPGRAFPAGADVDPEAFVALAADHHFRRTRLTPGIVVGVSLPASFTSAEEVGTLPASQTLVVRRDDDASILPVGRDATPIVATRASVRWDASEILSANLFVQYVRDENRTYVVVVDGATERMPANADRLGFGVTVQARY